MTIPGNPEVFGTGRMASPIKSPAGDAYAIFQGANTTLWFYPSVNRVVIQSTATPERQKEIKAQIEAKLREAITASQNRVAAAQSAIATAKEVISKAELGITSNQRDISVYQSAILELERQWPDEGSFFDD